MLLEYRGFGGARTNFADLIGTGVKTTLSAARKLGRNWACEPRFSEQVQSQRLLILKHHNVRISYALSLIPPTPYIYMCSDITYLHTKARSSIFILFPHTR